MKKLISALLLVAMICCLFAGCTTKESADTKVIKVGASVTPHAEILNQLKDVMAEKGYTLEVIEYNDYVLPNTATESGDIDANFFQHTPYLEDFNKENGTHLVAVTPVHYEPFGIYPGKTKTIDALQDGATIIVPNDGTNEARALMLLEAQGLIKLKEGADFTCTVLDIAENPKNLQIKELEAAQLARSLQDVDMAVINGNYAIEAGLNVKKDSIASEDAQSTAAKTYANVLVVKEGNENNEGIVALKEAMTSETIRTFINDKYEGAVVPAF